MIEFDPYRDRFVSPTVAPERAGLTEREFKAYKRPGSRLPLYRFPSVVPRSAGVDRYLVADLQRVAQGALL